MNLMNFLKGKSAAQTSAVVNLVVALVATGVGMIALAYIAPEVYDQVTAANLTDIPGGGILEGAGMALYVIVGTFALVLVILQQLG